MDLTKGWKTYASGALLMIWGAGGLYLGIHGPDMAISQISAGLGVIGLRHKLSDLALPKEITDKLK